MITLVLMIYVKLVSAGNNFSRLTRSIAIVIADALLSKPATSELFDGIINPMRIRI